MRLRRLPPAALSPLSLFPFAPVAIPGRTLKTSRLQEETTVRKKLLARIARSQNLTANPF